MRILALVLAAGVLALALGDSARADSDERRISVTGTGEAAAAPDLATLTLGVTTQAKEAREAMRATSEAAGRVLARLTEMGIEPRDMQTRSVTLNPVWDRRNSGDGPPRIVGFEASNTVFVRVRDLPKLGAVMDAVLTDGANRFGGLSFSVDDAEPLRDKARELAVQDAMSRASVLAKAAGIKLGPVLEITEHGGGREPMMMEAARMSDPGVPIAEGEVTISSSVAMVFAIQD